MTEHKDTPDLAVKADDWRSIGRVVNDVLVRALTPEQRQAIRDRARKAALALETEATRLWSGRLNLSAEDEATLLKCMDDAAGLTAFADALERKECKG